MHDKWQALRGDVDGVLQIVFGFLTLIVTALIAVALVSGMLWGLVHLVRRLEHHT